MTHAHTHSEHGHIHDSTTVDADEVAFFAKIADSWWDPTGPFKPLHQLNPTRLAYIRREITHHFKIDANSKMPYSGLQILDIGCGGGLISEPTSRLGADILGIDASEKNVKTATAHAQKTNATAMYQHITAEDLLKTGAQFDVIINMEVIEHVADVSAYLEACYGLLKPGGLMLLSTLNRTAKSFAFAIVGAEYILRWLPVGAHDWNKFIKPTELKTLTKQAGFTAQDATGFSYNPLSGRWSLSSSDLSVNYALSVYK